MATNLTAFDAVHTQNAFRSFITRFPFLVYAVLTLLLGWVPWYLAGEPTHLFFVPLLTALIMAPLVGGREGLMNFLRRMVRVRAPWYTWMVALLLPGAIALAAIAIHVLLGGQAPDAAMLKLNTGMLGQVAFIAISFFLPLGSDNLGEFGFRGFGIPALQGRWGSLLGTLILGLFVSLWFLPQFFNPDSPQTSMGGMAFFPFFLLTEVGWSMSRILYIVNSGHEVRRAQANSKRARNGSDFKAVSTMQGTQETRIDGGRQAEITVRVLMKRMVERTAGEKQRGNLIHRKAKPSCLYFLGRAANKRRKASAASLRRR